MLAFGRGKYLGDGNIHTKLILVFIFKGSILRDVSFPYGRLNGMAIYTTAVKIRVDLGSDSGPLLLWGGTLIRLAKPSANGWIGYLG